MESAQPIGETTASNGSLLSAVLGSFFVRLGGAATGVMLGFFFAGLHRAGLGQSSEMALSFLTAVFYLSELVGSPICGFLVDRRGARFVLLAGPILGIISEVFLATPSHFAVLGVARLIQGLTAAFTVPAALAYLSDATQHHPAGRGRIMGLFEVGSIGGIAVGYALGGYLWHWLHRPGFWLLAGLYTIAIGLFVFVRSDKRTTASPSPTASFRAIGRAVDLMPSWLAINAAAGIWFGQAAYQLSGGHTRESQLLTIGLSDVTIGTVFGIYVLLFAIGTIGWGLSLNRVGLTLPLRLGPVGMLIGAAALFEINHGVQFSGMEFGLWLAVGVVGVGVETAFTPAALTLLAARSDVVSSGRGAVMGVYAMLLAGGQLAGTLVGGVAAAALGVDGMIIATVVVAIIGYLTLPVAAAAGASTLPSFPLSPTEQHVSAE